MINIDDLPGHPDISVLKKGKVRAVYDLGLDRLLIIASDRISAFDVVLPTSIPGKGILLTQLSNFWFEKLADLAPNHLLCTDVEQFPYDLPELSRQLLGRSVIVRKLDILPFEFIVRGYISGSMWNAYKSGLSLPGITLNRMMRESEKLSEPLFTPTTKADSGHDLPVSFHDLAQQLGKQLADNLKDLAIRLYLTAAEYAEQRGIIIADTKFEFGMRDGIPFLADEVFTPDSSRFWSKDDYSPGRSQKSYDKQYVRDYLIRLGWDKTPPGPEIPDEIASETFKKYYQAYVSLTGSTLDQMLNTTIGTKK